MAQVKIYGRRDLFDGARQAISDAIHNAVVEAFELPADKRFHRFIPLDDADFVHPPDRSARYTIIEISAFEGRSAGAKKKLITRIFELLAERAGIAPHDVEVTITETPRANWGIRGKPGDELDLDYRVGV